MQFKQKLKTETETALQLKCDMCDYINVSEKGLKQHTRMKHKDFEILRNEDQNNSLNISDIVEECYLDVGNISPLSELSGFLLLWGV